MWLFLSISQFLSVIHFIKNSNSEAINLNGTCFVVRRGYPLAISCSKKTQGIERVSIQVLFSFKIQLFSMFFTMFKYDFICVNLNINCYFII